MSKLIVFEMVSADGFFVDAEGDMSWAHQHDPEWAEFTAGNAKGDAVLLFGRVTYEMMQSYWPTPAAKKAAPQVAKTMNEAQKVVVSKTLKKPGWQNTRVIAKHAVAEVKRLKAEAGKDVVVMGSGKLVAALAQAGLIDELQLGVMPLIVGSGRTLFDGVGSKIRLRRTKSRAFENGAVFNVYEPLYGR